MKLGRWTGRLETQAGVAVSSPKSSGHDNLTANSSRVSCCLEAELFLLWETSVFALIVIDCLNKAHHIKEDNLLSIKSTDYKCKSHLKNTFIAYLEWGFDQTTGHHSLAKLT